MPRCANCQQPLTAEDADPVAPKRGRKTLYCSDACKQRAYRQRKQREFRNANVLQNSSIFEVDSAGHSRGFKHPRNPPVRYVGGKWRIANWLMDYFPEHQSYIEPFGGGAAVLLQKPPSQLEVLNDLNHDVVNFFHLLAVQPAQLIRAIQLTPYAEDEYRRAHSSEGVTDAIERARRFYVRSRMSFGHSEGNQLSGWRYQTNTSRNLTLTDEWNRIDHLWATSERLKNVQITCSDYRRVLQRFDHPRALFYIDPPYPAQVRYEKRNYYRHEMLEDNQHRELAQLLYGLQGHVVLSGYACPLYSELFEGQGWQRFDKPTRANGNAPVTESIWLNPAAHAGRLPLFRGVVNE